MVLGPSFLILCPFTQARLLLSLLAVSSVSYGQSLNIGLYCYFCSLMGQMRSYISSSAFLPISWYSQPTFWVPSLLYYFVTLGSVSIAWFLVALSAGSMSASNWALSPGTSYIPFRDSGKWKCSTPCLKSIMNIMVMTESVRPSLGPFWWGLWGAAGVACPDVASLSLQLSFFP